jgi:hypothetical protein
MGDGIFRLDDERWWTVMQGEAQVSVCELLSEDGSRHEWGMAVVLPVQMRGSDEIESLHLLVSPAQVPIIIGALTEKYHILRGLL